MKKSSLFIAALCAVAGISACNTAPVQPELTEYTLSVEASMPTPDTKGLSLSGKTLNAVWAATDQVIVFQGNTQIGTLTPQSTGSATATLKGSITGSVSVGATLTLHTPRKSWLYNTNQDGTLSNLKNFAYARANVTVSSVNGGSVSTSAAHFENQQAMVKFTLLDDKGSTLTVDELKIEAASNKLVRVIADGTASYGSITVENDDEEDYLYAALRNDSGAADTYTLTADVNGTLYHCTKAGVLFENGKYYSVKATMEEEQHTYTIVGAPIFGSTWDPSDSNNDLVKQSDGTYKSKTYTVTTDPTTIEFKIVKDHDYEIGQWPGANYSVKAATGSFYVIFDPQKNDKQAIDPKYTPSQAGDIYRVAGDSEGDNSGTDAVFGTAWAPGLDANKMTLQTDGSYTKTYSNVAGGTKLRFKIVKNGAEWIGANNNGVVTDLQTESDGNCVYTKPSTGNVTIKFDPTDASGIRISVQ